MKLGALLSVVLAIEWPTACRGSALAPFTHGPGGAGRRSATSRTIGTVLFTTHAFAFEVTSILILVAMVGAVVIAGKPRSEH